jgi:DNA-binding MarR family transcriptional regulator
MESKNLKTLQLLEAIAEDKLTSQRELSDALQISLGLVNSFIKRLVKKGYCKATTIPRNRVRYILTPAGMMEKTRLTYEYISYSYRYFMTAKDRLQELYDVLQSQGATRIVFYGTGEIAEIAYLALTGTDIELADVVDPAKAGEYFANLIIKSFSQINQIDYDVLLITSIDHHETIINTAKQAGVPFNKIRFF